MDDPLIVLRRELDLENLWRIPEGCQPANLVRSTDGGPAVLATSVVAFYDAGFLYVIFRFDDDEVRASWLHHDDPLYEEDVVEVFLSPAGPATYFEFEVNPLGATFDARIESPAGTRASMQSFLEWEATGLWTASRKVQADGETPFLTETLIAIPFGPMGVQAPEPGNSWRGNFFRIDRSPRGDEFLAWRPTMKSPADFHVVSAFGRLLFQN